MAFIVLLKITLCYQNLLAVWAMTGHRLRAMGAHIKGTNGKSQGVVPF